MKRIFIMLSIISGIYAHADTALAPHLKKLQNSIAMSDAPMFAQQYEQSEITSEERVQLHDIAQSKKALLEQERTALGTRTLSIKKCAQGTLQLLGALYCAFNSGLLLGTGAWTLDKDQETEHLYHPPFALSAVQEDRDRVILPLSLVNKLGMLHQKLAIALILPNYIYGLLYSSFLNHRNIVTITVPTSLGLACGYGAYQLGKKGCKNIATGSQYRTHLEKQIQNIDEIMRLLTTNKQ